MSATTPIRFIGLDIHKHYLVAIGVNAHQEQVFGPHTVQFSRLSDWCKKHLTQQDALVMEMSTNSFELHDELLPFVHSVTLIHPPNVALIVKAQVKTDKKAALILTQLHAAGLLPAVWVPPVEIRELRGLIAHRMKMVRLSTQAKNRLHSLLHRYHIQPPEGDPFSENNRDWWKERCVSPLEKVRLESNLETLAFAEKQKGLMESGLADFAAVDERFPFLMQLPGFGLVVAMAVLAAIGDIARFPSAGDLVGYAGMGTRVHDSGLTHHTGRITKSGRRDLRTAMVQAARIATKTSEHWKKELEHKEVRMGYQKAIVAIARKLLVAVWHVLTERTADRFAEPERVARKFYVHAYNIGCKRRSNGQTAAEFIQQNMDLLGIQVESFKVGRRTVIISTSKEKAAAG